MVRVRTVLAGAMALAVAGCASGAAEHAALIPGLTSGPLPEPKPFVVESRPARTEQYPVIGYTPPPRRERPMTQAETDKLDAGLQAAAGIRKKRLLVPPPAQ